MAAKARRRRAAPSARPRRSEPLPTIPWDLLWSDQRPPPNPEAERRAEDAMLRHFLRCARALSAADAWACVDALDRLLVSRQFSPVTFERWLATWFKEPVH